MELIQFYYEWSHIQSIEPMRISFRYSKHYLSFTIVILEIHRCSVIISVLDFCGLYVPNNLPVNMKNLFSSAPLCRFYFHYVHLYSNCCSMAGAGDYLSQIDISNEV